MTQEKTRPWKRAVSSRYAHLFLGLMILFGISSAVTYTSPFDKITEGLRRYCYAEYRTKIPHFFQYLRELEFYRQKYRERLEALTGGAFGEKKEAAQAYFLDHGFLYDSWEENENRSYLLAKILEKGVHEAHFPDEVRFDYLLLGRKKIVPFSEYMQGPGAGAFISAGEKAIYLYKDSLEPVLQWYFDSLWIAEPKESQDFYGDPLSYSLYRDLQEICEAAAANRRYVKKEKARQVFVEDGFRTFLPALLSMGAKMEADRKNGFSSDYQYLRACLTALSLNPNYTMFHLLKTERVHAFSPMAKKGWKVFSQRLGLTYPEQITPEEISETSRDILKELEDFPD